MNPLFGVFFHWLGGFASGSFYVPYRRVRLWSWETYWLVGGFFSWIIMPPLMAFLMTKDLPKVLHHQSLSTLLWTYLFGALWGLGGLTFGLTMRYLGLSLGMGVALGYCAAFGTLLPPIMKMFLPQVPVDENIAQIASTLPGQITLLGVIVCLLGIAVTALAGLTKEREMSDADKKKSIAEFNFPKGIALATFSGIMSACFAFALAAARPLGESSLAAGTDSIWTGLPKLVVVLLGGFTTNFIWCAHLHRKNHSAYQYLASTIRPEHTTKSSSASEHGQIPSTEIPPIATSSLRIPVANNYLFSALAGIVWYLQFFFYTMGETQMGRYGFASWTLHMASIIIFSTMWGWILHEWKGASRKTHHLIGLGILILILSTLIIGVGAWMKTPSPHP
jgi:L-rhamnose-H+ transport protein